MSESDAVVRQSAELEANVRGCPVYIRDGKIYERGPGERVVPSGPITVYVVRGKVRGKPVWLEQHRTCGWCVWFFKEEGVIPLNVHSRFDHKEYAEAALRRPDADIGVKDIEILEATYYPPVEAPWGANFW